MAVELKIPTSGESISEVQVGAWLKSQGEYVEQDAPVVEIESDKATVEVYAPVSGTISKVVLDTGETAAPGDVVGYMEKGEKPAAKEEKGEKEEEQSGEAEEKKAEAAEQEEKAEEKKAEAAEESKPAKAEKEPARKGEAAVLPAAQRLMEQHGVEAGDVDATGPGGRILKEDVQRVVEGREGKAEEKKRGPKEVEAPKAPAGPREEERVPMSPMRKRIAEHLVQAQQTAALLTTFNEADMSGVMALREDHKAAYQDKYGIKLGFMSFFVKAAVEALKAFPQVNAEVRGTDIIYKNYYDIGIAVGGGKGLVVPVLRNAERMSFADIELSIDDFGKRAQKNKIDIEELKGGTFTISNGGIYGSLLSTPIVNPPQSGILGMHAIQERPVVREGEIVIRPMMYLAMSYDHRIVDGREAVSFLKRIKECVEQPSRILLEI